jgi:hypothetical protein
MVHHIVRQPLNSTFMLTSMIGFAAAFFIVWPISKPWGFTFAVTFGLFLLSSIYNFTHAPDEDDLAVHEPHRHLRHYRAYRK